MKKINKNILVECLLNNYVAVDFLAAFKPYIATQSLFLMPQITITNGFITPTNRTSYIKSFFGLFCLLILHFYRYVFLKNIFKHVSVNDPTVLMATIDFIIHGFGVILIYIVTIYQSQNTVILMLRLQRAMNTMDADNFRILRTHKIWSWFSTIGVLFFYIISNAASVLFRGDQLLLSTVLFGDVRYATVVCDLNQVYLIRTVAFISNILESWNHKMLTYQETHLDGSRGFNENKKTLEDLIQVYIDIMKAYDVCKTVYEPLIVFKTFTSFFSTLNTINLCIQFEKAGRNFPAVPKILSFLWNIKNVVLLVLMSATCEQLYAHARSAAATCARAVAARESGLRKTCKNVLRYSRAAGGKLRACGVLAVDAALPLRFLGVVVAYIVVLLQFALQNI